MPLAQPGGFPCGFQRKLSVFLLVEAHRQVTGDASVSVRKGPEATTKPGDKMGR